MNPTAHLDHLRADTAALAAACRLGTDASVRSCPGWDVARLAEHVGRVHRWVVRSLDAPSTERVDFIVDGDPEPGDDLAGWYAERAGELLERFDAIDPDTIVATFMGPLPATWWMRRQAHEVAVHRWDAQDAHGTPEPIDATLASDGVDEYLGTFYPRFKGKLGAVGGTIHLHCTDVDGEWFLRVEDGAPVVERTHAKGDVAARGDASSLMLLVWGRVSPDAIDVIGDRGVLERWLQTINVI